jgi:putative redox protein
MQPSQTFAREVVVEGSATGFTQQITAGPHSFVADEPTSAGGADSGPNPYELLLGALGACTSMTVALVARRRRWPLERVVVRLRHRRSHAEDCADREKPTGGRIDHLEVTVELVGDALTVEQRAALVAIAEKCPLKKTLAGPIAVEVRGA